MTTTRKDKSFCFELGVFSEGRRGQEVVRVKPAACLDCGGKASFWTVVKYAVQHIIQLKSMKIASTTYPK